MKSIFKLHIFKLAILSLTMIFISFSFSCTKTNGPDKNAARNGNIQTAIQGVVTIIDVIK